MMESDWYCPASNWQLPPQMRLESTRYPIPDEEPSGDLELQQLTSRAMAQVQSEFETRTWQAFWRSVVDGIATDTVADELQMSNVTVRQSRSRILRRLREQLGDVE